ncbi:hypothetical protein GCM10027280_53660 [Micromonospora polyrhachis]|uniref:Uncharacterized protein n=1 Tax=Micromonospora polyrhachis TaxID=1282883 RepID=A0A7W7SK79_9ACTN|nr:hypothetical protein [Micromonospora polyrhachis]
MNWHRKPARTAAVLFGLGVGATVGPSLGPAAVRSGVAITALGIGLSLIGTTESDLVGMTWSTATRMPGWPATRRLREQRSPRNDAGGFESPTLGGLGTRVEQILELAEEQAGDHCAEARLESERIVTAARREADAILNRAREQAVGITGRGRDSSPTPPTRGPSPNDDPSRHA